MYRISRGIMKIKKTILGIFFLIFLNGCVQNTALIGPAYTLGSNGNVFQASLSYGSGKLITSRTGKSVEENITEILQVKRTDTEFQKLVKNNIKKTRKKLNLSK